MEKAAYPRRRPDLTLEGLVDMDQTLSLGPQCLLTTSPLSLLSPNALHAKARQSPAAIKPDGLGELPRFARRKPDPRRQSSAIFAGFAQATAGAGLLDDDEIAVGDEDILISLPVAAKSQVTGAGHSTLWLEPHTEELLGDDLPEPEFDDALGGSLSDPDFGAALGSLPDPEFGGALGGALAPIPESPSTSRDTAELARCPSPVYSMSPAKRAASRPVSRASSRGGTPQKAALSRGGTPQKALAGVRDSTVLSEGLSKMCLEVGFDDWDTEDFQMQDGNKVKEMAFLFKMESDAKAASPASSPRPAQPDPVGPSDATDSSKPSSSVKARVGKLQSVAKPAAADKPLQKATARPQLRPAASGPSTGDPSAKAGSDAASKAAAPGAAARPSRLRPPSTSSSYFSHTVTENRPGAPAAAQQRSRPPPAGRAPIAPATAATRSLPAPPRPSSSLRAPGAAASRVGPAPAAAAASSPARPAVSRPSTAPAPLRSSPAVSRPATVPSPACPAQPASAAAGTSTAARVPPVRSRLAQSSIAQPGSPLRAAAAGSRGSSEQPASAAGVAGLAADQQRRGMPTQRMLSAAASRLRLPTGPTCSTPTSAARQAPPSSIASATKLPKLRIGSPAVSPSGSESTTPNTARIRFLEQHPELVFGGGSKVGNSPKEQDEEQPARRKTAEERHLEEWGEHF